MSLRRDPPADADPPLPQGTTDSFAVFLREHSEWVARFGGYDTVYAIPPAAVDVLARPAGSRVGPVFDRANAEAEREFARLCGENGAIGLVPDEIRPVRCNLLTDAAAEVDEVWASALNWTTAQVQTFQELAEFGTESRRRLRGVVGWLLTEPAFLRQVTDVRRMYLALPAGGRPWFPLGRLLHMADDAPHEDLSAFAAALRGLLDRWGLIGLEAWDMPTPQGPLLPVDLSPGSVARPAHGVYVYVPVHYPMQGDDALQRRVAEYQRREAERLGVDKGFAGTTHFATYGQMFRVLHLERAVRQRFAKLPRGCAGAIEAAAAAALDLSVDRVQRLRKDINACRAGRRSRVKALRVAD